MDENREKQNDTTIIGYITAMTLANRMLDQGILLKKEFLAFEEKMHLKYSLPKCSLYRDFHLLSGAGQR